MKPQDRTRQILASGFGPTVKLVLVAIADRCNAQDAEARPSIADLHEATSIAQSSIRDAIREAVRVGALVRRERDAHGRAIANEYALVLTVLPPKGYTASRSTPPAGVHRGAQGDPPPAGGWTLRQPVGDPPPAGGPKVEPPAQGAALLAPRGASRTAAGRGSPPEGFLSAVALWREHRTGVDLDHTRGDGKVLAAAIRGYGAEAIQRTIAWVFTGPDPWARDNKLTITQLFRPSNVEGWIEKAAGFTAGPPRKGPTAEEADARRRAQEAALKPRLRPTLTTIGSQP